MTEIQPRKGLAGATVAGLLIASAQAPLGSTLIAVALPSIGAGFGDDLVMLTGLLVTSYLVVNVVCQGPGGKISDLIGHPRTVWTGSVLYAAAAVLGLLAPEKSGPGVPMLVLSRCIMAMAGALVVPATLALLRLNVAPDRRGRVFGLFGATMGLSAAFGPILGGEIVSLFGWRAIFFANLPFIAIAGLLLHFRPPPDNKTRVMGLGDRPLPFFDFAGTGLLALALGLLVGAGKMDGSGRALALGASLVSGVLFVIWETRMREPILDPRLFLNPVFAAGTCIMALQNFAMYGLLFQLPQFFERFRGTPPRETGYMLFSMMIGMVFAAPVGGRLADRFGARNSALLGSATLLAGNLMLCRLATFATTWDAVPSLLAFGVGIGLCSAPSQSASMSAIGPAHAGMAAGAGSTMRYLGGIASIMVLGTVLGRDASVSEGAHQLMIRIFAVAVALSVVASLRLTGKSPVLNP